MSFTDPHQLYLPPKPMLATLLGKVSSVQDDDEEDAGHADPIFEEVVGFASIPDEFKRAGMTDSTMMVDKWVPMSWFSHHEACSQDACNDLGAGGWEIVTMTIPELEPPHNLDIHVGTLWVLLPCSVIAPEGTAHGWPIKGKGAYNLI